MTRLIPCSGPRYVFPLSRLHRFASLACEFVLLILRWCTKNAPERWDVLRKHSSKECLPQTIKVTLQLYGMGFKRCAARWFTKTRINTQSESRMVSEMRETWGFSCSNFNYPIGGGGEETKAEVGEEKREGGGCRRWNAREAISVWSLIRPPPISW